MADTKISALSAGTAAPGDEIPINRGGSNFKITAGDILKINGGTITANSPVLDLTQTWNNAAVTFTGLKFNVPTDSSAAGSLLMDLQVGGASRVAISKATTRAGSNTGGEVLLSNSTNSTKLSLGFDGNNHASIYATNGLITFRTADYVQQLNINTAGVHIGSSSGVLSFNGGYGTAATGDTVLARDAADTLAQRRTTNAQTFRIYNTYTDASNYERGKISWSSNVLQIGTEKAGTGTARALELQTDGTTRVTIGTTGAITTTGAMSVGGSINTNASGTFSALGRSVLSSPSNGIWLMNVNAGGDFDRLQFGGTTSSFPALKRSSATLISRLADDSANAAFEAASLKTDAPAGGTAATWKLGAVATVSPTSPNRTIEVDIGGTIYYLHAKTTND